MKILMLTPYLPYPLLSGGQIRTYNLLKNLSRKHSITLFSFIRHQDEKKHLKELNKYCHKVKVFKRRPAWDFKNIILAGFTPYPFLVAIYLSNRLRQAVAQELKAEKYHLIHAETFYVCPNIPKTRTPILLVEQTIEYLGYQTFARQTKILPLKPFLFFDVVKIKFWEKHFWKKANQLITMSKDDKKFIASQTHGKINIDVVANGVDIKHFEQIKKVIPAKPTVLFVGNFKWLPNLDAATFLATQVWPQVLKLKPQAQLKIVGANPTKDIRRLGEIKNVSVLGDIADIRDAFKDASVMLSPVRNGRGTRYKILESMATKTPVVATHLGVEGLDIKPGEHALVSDDPKKLASLTAKVLNNKKLAQKLSDNGKKLVTTKYNWLTISANLDKIYQTLGNK